jgi:hypothetical protein
MTKPITHVERALVLVARLRLVLAIAGVAWLLGYSPAVAGRVVVGLVVGLVLVLDAVAGATADTKVGVTPGRKGGAA